MERLADFLIVVIVSVLAVLILAPMFENDRIFSEWEGACNIQKGQVVKVSSSRYECYIDGKMVVLKGYEKYQKVGE